jgi:hypothetical protein
MHVLTENVRIEYRYGYDSYSSLYPGNMTSLCLLSCIFFIANPALNYSSMVTLMIQNIHESLDSARCEALRFTTEERSSPCQFWELRVFLLWWNIHDSILMAACYTMSPGISSCRQKCAGKVGIYWIMLVFKFVRIFQGWHAVLKLVQRALKH